MAGILLTSARGSKRRGPGRDEGPFITESGCASGGARPGSSKGSVGRREEREREEERPRDRREKRAEPVRLRRGAVRVEERAERAERMEEGSREDVVLGAAERRMARIMMREDCRAEVRGWGGEGERGSEEGRERWLCRGGWGEGLGQRGLGDVGEGGGDEEGGVGFEEGCREPSAWRVVSIFLGGVMRMWLKA